MATTRLAAAHASAAQAPDPFPPIDPARVGLPAEAPESLAGRVQQMLDDEEIVGGELLVVKDRRSSGAGVGRSLAPLRQISGSSTRHGETRPRMKILMTGGTGMVGGLALRDSLRRPEVTEVTPIGRRPSRNARPPLADPGEQGHPRAR